MAFIGPYQIYTIDPGELVARVRDLEKLATSVSGGLAQVRGQSNDDAAAKDASTLVSAKAHTDTEVGKDRGRLATLETDKWLKPSFSGPGRDLNTFTTSGFTGVIYGVTANIPVQTVGTLEVFAFGTGVIQRYTTWEASPRMFLRRYNGSWGAWAEQPSAATLTTQNNRLSALESSATAGLADWRAALRSATTAPAQILMIGDSITEGTGATTLANRWQTVLQTYLCRQSGNLAGAEFPFIPARYATSAPGQPVTSSGTITGGFGWGFGWRTLSLRGDDAEVTFTFTGTSAKVMYLQNSTNGVMSVSVDGGAPVLVNTNGATNSAAVWSTGALTRGAHTVTVKRSPTSTAGQWVYVEGLLTYDGDETKGVRLIDAAKHGINSGQFTQSNTDYIAIALKAAGPFAAAVIGVGTNDYSAGTSAADYRANIERQIIALRSLNGGFTGSIVLVNMFKGQGRDEAAWAVYADQLAAIAAADNKVSYVDLRWDMPDVPTPVTDVSGQGLYVDGLHPSDAGHRRIAGVLAKVLT